MQRYREKLAEMQKLLYAEHKRSLLVVLQAPDAGGKDGTISHVMGAWNPQGATRHGIQTADAARTGA
jgi:polyphosphate kinase 2 (PPK2 family)